MILAESHCHLDLYPPSRREDMLEQAKSLNIQIMLNMGMNLESSADSIKLAQLYPEILAAVGIHPWEAVPLASAIQDKLMELVRHERVVAVGEIGLDYKRNQEDSKIQRELFEYELSLAKDADLPVSIHCRDAHEDMMAILRRSDNVGIKGALHEGAEDWKAIKDWLDLDFYIAVSVRGFVEDEIYSLVQAIKKVPLDRLLIETDAAGDEYVVEIKELLPVLKKLADLREINIKKMAEITTNNLKRLLNI